MDLKGKTIVMNTNDTHGRIVANEESIGLSGVSALKQHLTQQGAEVILLDAGDTLHGLTTATLDKGKSILSLLERVGYTAVSPGNHDYNYGYDYLYSLTSTSSVRFMAANVFLSATSTNAFGTEYLILEKNRKKIGIFGLSTPDTVFSTHPNNVKSLTFANPIETAKTEVSKLKTAGCDYIIALTHLGLFGDYSSRLLAQGVEGIDLIVDGHSHSVLPNGEVHGDTTIISSGEYIKNVGVYIIEDQKYHLKDHQSMQGVNDPAIDAEIAKITEAQNLILNEVVTEIPVDLIGDRKYVRTQENGFGNVICDAIRQAAGSQIAVLNGGSIRASLKAGKVTKGQIIDVLPFGNYIVTKSIEGKAIYSILEQSVQSYPEEYGGFLHVSGLTFKFDPLEPVGSRVFDVMVGNQVLDYAAMYTVAINDFQAAGGDGFDVFKSAKTLSELPAIDEILINYLSGKPKLNPNPEGRITIERKPQFWYF